MEDKEKIKQLEKELAEAKAESKAKSEFLSMVTHQLRTPPSGLKWIFQMLLSGDLGSLNEEEMKIIEKGAASNQSMIDLLQEITTANHTNNWDFQYNFSKTDLIHILEELITEFLEEAHANNITVNLQHPTEPLPLVKVDTGKIKLALQNLIDNAIKYSDEGTSISISTAVNNDSVIVAVQDHGIGIPEDQHDKIFEKFFRSENAKEKSKKGVGLGLFTAKNIVEKHHGKLWFESTVGQGTTFFCELPLSQ